MTKKKHKEILSKETERSAHDFLTALQEGIDQVRDREQADKVRYQRIAAGHASVVKRTKNRVLKVKTLKELQALQKAMREEMAK